MEPIAALRKQLRTRVRTMKRGELLKLLSIHGGSLNGLVSLDGLSEIPATGGSYHNWNEFHDLMSAMHYFHRNPNAKDWYHAMLFKGAHGRFSQRLEAEPQPATQELVKIQAMIKDLARHVRNNIV